MPGLSLRARAVEESENGPSERIGLSNVRRGSGLPTSKGVGESLTFRALFEGMGRVAHRCTLSLLPLNGRGKGRNERKSRIELGFHCWLRAFSKNERDRWVDWIASKSCAVDGETAGHRVVDLEPDYYIPCLRRLGECRDG